MRISDSLTEQLILKAHKATEEQLTTLRQQNSAWKQPFQDLVIQKGLVTEKDLTELYAADIGIPYTELNPTEMKWQTLKLIPEQTAKQYNVVLFGIENDGSKLLAMEDPNNLQAVSSLQQQLGDQVKVYVATTSNIQAVLELYRTNASLVQDTTTTVDDQKPTADKVSMIGQKENFQIAQTVHLLIEQAIRSRATDIHIEPRDNSVAIRYRIDGVLRKANNLSKQVQGALISHIKTLAKLRVNEFRVPQNGHLKIQVDAVLYSLRVSTLPTADGEKVAVRILNESSQPATLESLGFWGTTLAVVNESVKQSHGLVLVTGPTGSGKSSSLFSLLTMLNNSSVNISTVEEYVEYKIPGANQLEVNTQAGVTFAAGLRALAGQDPNIIMVGEIRDCETAELTVQAALTGHLVFGAVHTKNAVSCLQRLLDMGIEPFLIASTVRAVVGQRLVRRLCPDCREPYEPNITTLKQVAGIFGTDSSGIMKRVHLLEEQALQAGITIPNPTSTVKKNEDLSTTASAIKRLWRSREDGCDACSHTGYQGRVGIYEALRNSADIQKLIVGNASSNVIQHVAVKEGMVTMQVDGFIKALRGITSIEELLKVTG